MFWLPDCKTIHQKIIYIWTMQNWIRNAVKSVCELFKKEGWHGLMWWSISLSQCASWLLAVISTGHSLILLNKYFRHWQQQECSQNNQQKSKLIIRKIISSTQEEWHSDSALLQLSFVASDLLSDSLLYLDHCSRQVGVNFCSVANLSHNKEIANDNHCH